MAQDVKIRVSAEGAEKAKQKLKGVQGSISGLGKAVGIASTAYFGAKGLISGFSSVINLAGQQEQAEKKLEVALGRRSQALLDQASALQQVTTFGDEAIIGVQASIGAFLDSEDQIKKATEATLDIASAMGMDLKSAGDLVAKTLGSSTNAMSRYGIEVQGAVGSSERLESMTKNVAKLFGGQAQAEAETLTGSIEQMSNAIGDAGEVIGGLLAPMVIKVAKGIKSLAEGVGNVIGKFKEFGKEVDAVLLDEKTVELNNFRDSIKGLSKEELLELNKKLSGTEGSLSIVNDQTVLLSEKNQILIDTYNKLSEAQEIAKQKILELGEGVEAVNEIRRAEIEGIKSVKTAEEMSNEERLAIRQSFSEQMRGMFNSDFDMQRVLMSQQAEAFRQAGVDEVNIARFVAEQKKQIRANEISFQVGAISQLIGGLGKLNTASKGSALVSKRLAQTQAIIDTYAGANKALASAPPPFNFALAGAVIASGLANVMTIEAQKFADGGIVQGNPSQGDVNPALLTAGEVVLNQAQQENLAGGMKGNVTVNISAPVIDDTVVDRIIPAINSAVKEGRADLTSTRALVDLF